MALEVRALAAPPEDLGLTSNNPHGGSQPSLTLVPGDMMGLEWKLHDIHGAQKHKKAKHPHTLIQIKMKIGQMVGRLNVSN